MNDLNAKYLFYTQVVILAMFVFGKIWDWYGKRAIRLELNAAKQEVKDKLEASERAVKEKLNDDNQKIVDRFEQNAEATKQAFTEANNYNAKLVTLQKQIADLRREWAKDCETRKKKQRRVSTRRKLTAPRAQT